MKRGRHGLSDTSPDAQRVQTEIYRRMPAWRKVQLLDDANRTARQLAMIGLRRRHPGEPPALLRRRLLGLILGEETAERVYGPLVAPGPPAGPSGFSTARQGSGNPRCVDRGWDTFRRVVPQRRRGAP